MSKIVPRFPEETGEALIKLSSPACLTADATDDLRHVLNVFEKDQPVICKYHIRTSINPI